ncbi:glycoside hydrolase family 32 protein [Acetobacteraceae bacterium]|nr:glycoside hydrolase family 32 protein [Acetobacteraceae bacterium]
MKNNIKLTPEELRIFGENAEANARVPSKFRPISGGQAVIAPATIPWEDQTIPYSLEYLKKDTPHEIGHWPVFTDAAGITKDENGVLWSMAAYSKDAYFKVLKNQGPGGWIVDGMMQVYSFDGIKWYSFRELPNRINIARNYFIDPKGKFMKGGKIGDWYAVYDNDKPRSPSVVCFKDGPQTALQDLEFDLEIEYKQDANDLVYGQGGSDCTIGYDAVHDVYVLTGQTNDDNQGAINFWTGKTGQTMAFQSSYQPYTSKYRIECQSIPLQVVDRVTGEKVWVLSYCVQNQNTGDTNSWDNWFEISVGDWDGKNWIPNNEFNKRITYGYDQYAGNLEVTEDPHILTLTTGCFNWNRYNQDQLSNEVGQLGGFGVPMKIVVDNGVPNVIEDPAFKALFKEECRQIVDNVNVQENIPGKTICISGIVGAFKSEVGASGFSIIVENEENSNSPFIISCDGTGTDNPVGCSDLPMPWEDGDRITMILDNGLCYVTNVTKGTRSASLFQHPVNDKGEITINLNKSIAFISK